jgi:flavin-binding protein dodecin
LPARFLRANPADRYERQGRHKPKRLGPIAKSSGGLYLEPLAARVVVTAELQPFGLSGFWGVFMAEPAYKKIEVVGTSPNSFAEATANGVAKAAETVHGISWFEVDEMRGSVADGKVKQYQVTLKIGFKVD